MESGDSSKINISNLFEFGKIFLKWSWLLIIIASLAGFLAYYLSDLKPRVYQSSTRILVNVSSNVADVDGSTQPVQLTNTYAKTLVTKALLNVASEKLGYPITGSIRASADTISPIIEIVVTDNEPVKAANTANAVAITFIEDVETKQTSRYKELETSIEDEIARIDAELTSINQELADLQLTSGRLSTEISSSDTEEYVKKAQLELLLTQLTQTRYSLVYNLQQVRLSEIKSVTILTQLDPAVPNYNPVEPQPVKAAVIGGVLGLFFASGLVFLVVYLQDKIRDPREITQVWGVPVLGLIPINKMDNKSVISMIQPRTPFVEAYRVLRANLQYANIDKPIHTILITSPSSGDGKSTVSSNLAVVTSQNNSKVILADCDLRKPTIHKLFQLTNRSGLTDLFINKQAALSGAFKKTRVEGLTIITSGKLPPYPSALLNSNAMEEILEKFKQQSDLVILDSPPILSMADAVVLAPRVDGVILVVNLQTTKRSMLLDSINQLQQVKTNLLGVVVNGVKVKRAYKYYYNRYYGKQHSATEIPDEYRYRSTMRDSTIADEITDRIRIFKDEKETR